MTFELNQVAELAEEFETLFARINNEEIRFGYKTSRGNGIFKVERLLKKQFNENDFEEYLNFDLLRWSNESDEIIVDEIDKPNDFELNLPIEVINTINIREYAYSKNNVDSSHIKCNGKPVITGTSIAGAIRHQMIETLYRLINSNNYTYQDATDKVNELFGYINDKENHKSDIYFNEVILEDTKDICMDHVKIDRFTGGAVDSAKFDEQVCAGGKGTLNIIVKNQEQHQALIGLLIIVLQELNYGLLAIGGETSIGRGLIRLTNTDQLDEKLITNIKNFKMYINKLKGDL